MFFNCISMGKLPLIFAFIFKVLVSIVMEYVIRFEVWFRLGIRPIVVEGLLGLIIAMGVLIVKEGFQGLGNYFNCIF